MTLRTLMTGISATTIVALTACSPGSDDDASASGATVKNCDIGVKTDDPPQRIYAAFQPAIEIAHALGLSDRLVGTAYLDSEVLPEYRDAQAEVEYLPTLPSRDVLLAENPDFVLSGFNGVFSAEGDGSSFGSRGSLAELGVQSWILSPLCPSKDGQTDEAIDPATVTLDAVHQDLRDLGTLFDVEDRAEAVIADQQERVDAVAKRVKGKDRPTVAIVRVLDDGLNVAGGIDFGTRVIEAAGGENAFEDLTQTRNVKIDVEELIRRDPDVILTAGCCDAKMTVKDAEPDAASVRDDPALSGLTAVKEDRVHPFLFADYSAGVRVAHAVEMLADLLHPQS